MRAFGIIGVVLGTALGCTGTIGDGPNRNDPAFEPPPPPSGDPTAAGLQGIEARLHRLTRQQYNNIVADVFGDETRPADVFPPDARSEGYSFPVPLTPALFELYATIGNQTARRWVATGDWDAGCSSEGDACARALIAGVGQRLYRRPLSSVDVDRAMVVFREAWDGSAAQFSEGVEFTTAAMLQSPRFLYRTETLTSDEPLDAFDRASRLAFLFWNTGPQSLVNSTRLKVCARTPSDCSIAHATRWVDSSLTGSSWISSVSKRARMSTQNSPTRFAST